MKRAVGVQAQDRLAPERWIDEGGRVAPEALTEPEMAAEADSPAGAVRQRGRAAGPGGEGGSTADTAVPMTASAQNRARPRVLIAGAGVAGLETLMALRALAADRVEITIVAPELKFINRGMSVQQPFKPQRRRGLRLEDIAAELGARWHRGALDQVEHRQHRVVTKVGDELPYDRLVLALGARPRARVAVRGSAHLSRRARRPQLPATARPGPRGPGGQAGIRQASRGQLAAAAL